MSPEVKEKFPKPLELILSLLIKAQSDKKVDFAIKALSKVDNNEIDILNKYLLKASGSPASCVDERKVLTIYGLPQIYRLVDGKPEPMNNKDIKKKGLDQIQSHGAGMPGGALGFVQLYMMLGQTQEKAIQSTVDLYHDNDWELVIHNDAHTHGGDILADENFYQGCGYSGVYKDAANLTYQLLQSNITKLDEPGNVSDTAVDVQKVLMKEHGAYMVMLDGNHKEISDGVLGVITTGNEVFNMPAAYGQGGAFELGLGVLATPEVLDSFNKNLDPKKHLDLSEFKKLLVVNYVVTLQLLGKLEDNGANIAVLG